MTILTWYQEILKEGLQEGRQEGLLEGKVELTLKQLSRRFGNLQGDITLKINQLTVKQIDDLAENIFDFTSIEDVKNWLNRL